MLFKTIFQCLPVLPKCLWRYNKVHLTFEGLFILFSVTLHSWDCATDSMLLQRKHFIFFLFSLHFILTISLLLQMQVVTSPPLMHSPALLQLTTMLLASKNWAAQPPHGLIRHLAWGLEGHKVRRQRPGSHWWILTPAGQTTTAIRMLSA